VSGKRSGRDATLLNFGQDAYAFNPFALRDLAPMNEPMPDRLAVNPKSPFHNADLLARGVGIRFNGKERVDVEEYCVSEGWVRVAAGRARDRHGNPMTIKLKGEVVPYLQDLPVADASEPLAEDAP
jgi:hypothetical protein